MSLKKPHPFTKLFDFAYQRSTPQAFGFYFAHLIIYLLVSGVLMGFLLAPGFLGPDFKGQVESARLLGPALGLTHALVLTVLVLKKKGLDKRGRMVAFGALATLLGGLGGPIASLGVISWLTTKASERPIELH